MINVLSNRINSCRNSVCFENDPIGRTRGDDSGTAISLASWEPMFPRNSPPFVMFLCVCVCVCVCVCECAHVCVCVCVCV